MYACLAAISLVRLIPHSLCTHAKSQQEVNISTMAQVLCHRPLISGASFWQNKSSSCLKENIPNSFYHVSMLSGHIIGLLDTSLTLSTCHQVSGRSIFQWWRTDGDFSCNVLMSPSPQGANILGTITFTKKAKQHKNVAQMDKRVGWKILQDDFLKTVLQVMLSLCVITPFLFNISCCRREEKKG